MEVGREQAGWIIFACRTDYAAEAAVIICRREEGIALLVDNLPDGARSARSATPNPTSSSV